MNEPSEPVAKLADELPLLGGRITRALRLALVCLRGRILGMIDWVGAPRRLDAVPDWRHA